MFNKALLLLFEKATGKKVASVACSVSTTWYVTTEGDLYGCGRGDYGQQGSGSTTSRLSEFTKRN